MSARHLESLRKITRRVRVPPLERTPRDDVWRFPTLAAVINHYDSLLGLGLTSQEKSDLAEYLKSL